MTHRQSWLPRIRKVQAQGRIPIIAEIKAYSPSVGELLGRRSAAKIAQSYEAGGAACLSVVTGRWFGGDISLLSQVAEATSLPLLRKDFIINRDQITQSRDYGANAVLLTKKILETAHLKKMIDLCLSLEVTPFVEVSDIKEIKACQLGPETIVGITNRDIAQKESDVHSGLKSMKLIGSAADILGAGALISASGISTSSQANILYQAGFDGLLIGSALMKAPHPGDAVSEYTQLKQSNTKRKSQEADGD